MIRKSLLFLVILLMSGCATNYNSAKSIANGYEIIICSEQDILDSAYEAIEREFPNTSITRLAGNKIGYSFYAQPMLDRTTFDFIIQEIETTLEGKQVTGYVYSIKTYGTQWFVNSRYVNPLIEKFERVLARKRISIARVKMIRYAK